MSRLLRCIVLVQHTLCVRSCGCTVRRHEEGLSPNSQYTHIYPFCPMRVAVLSELFLDVIERIQKSPRPSSESYSGGAISPRIQPK